MLNAALDELSPAFAEMYSRAGRPSIAPEKQLRVILLQMFYSGRGERMLMDIPMMALDPVAYFACVGLCYSITYQN